LTGKKGSPSWITVVARRGKPRRFSFDGASWDEKFIPRLELADVLLKVFSNSLPISFKSIQEVIG
jgi:hypothetical protein